MKNLLILLSFVLLIWSCTEINDNITTLSTLTVIEGDTINITTPTINIHIDNDFIDSSRTIINTTNLNNNFNLNSFVDSSSIKLVVNIIDTAKKELCIDIPTPPLVINVIQPSKNTKYGSVTLTGLPNGNWTLIRFPDKVIQTGNSTILIVNDLDPRWTNDNGGKCYTTTFKWVVVNKCGVISLFSEEAIINSFQ
jgi:hypothetical protein